MPFVRLEFGEQVIIAPSYQHELELKSGVVQHIQEAHQVPHPFAAHHQRCGDVRRPAQLGADRRFLALLARKSRVDRDAGQLDGIGGKPAGKPLVAGFSVGTRHRSTPW